MPEKLKLPLTIAADQWEGFKDRTLDEFFEEIDGKLRAQTTGTQPVVNALLETKERLKDKHEKVGDQAEQIAALTDVVQQLRDKLEGGVKKETAKDLGITPEQLDAELTKRAREMAGKTISSLQVEVESLKKERDEFKGTVETREGQDAKESLRKAQEQVLGKSEPFSNALPYLAQGLDELGFNSLDDDGKLVALDSEGNAIPSSKGKGAMTYDEAIESLKGTHDFGWPSGVKGGTGATSAATSKAKLNEDGTVKNPDKSFHDKPIKEWTEDQKMDYTDSEGADAWTERLLAEQSTA